MHDAAFRKRQSRQKLRGRHLKAYEVWLPDTRVAALRHPDESVSALVVRALDALQTLHQGTRDTLEKRAEGRPSGKLHQSDGETADRLAEAYHVSAPPLDQHPQQRKAALVQRLRAMHTAGLSLQAIARQLNAEGVPTISGRGAWQKGTVSNLLAQAHA